jgi:hypothetical protein
MNTIVYPRRMREGNGSRSVWVSVCYRATGYVTHLEISNAVLFKRLVSTMNESNSGFSVLQIDKYDP